MKVSAALYDTKWQNTRLSRTSLKTIMAMFHYDEILQEKLLF